MCLHRAETSVYSETLNLPGGQQQGQVLGDRYSGDEFASRMSMRPQRKLGTEGLMGREGHGTFADKHGVLFLCRPWASTLGND